MDNNKNIFERISDHEKNRAEQCAARVDALEAKIKAKTSGPRWDVVKAAGAGIVIVGAVGAIISGYMLLIAAAGVAVILGMAAKS